MKSLLIVTLLIGFGFFLAYHHLPLLKPSTIISGPVPNQPPMPFTTTSEIVRTTSTLTTVPPQNSAVIKPKETIKPTPVLVAPLTIQPPSPQPPKETIVEIPINLRSIVVLRCLYKDSYGNQKKVFGSGVIISPEGLVLTARHVVDQEYTLAVTGGQQGFSGYILDHCDVGQAPSDSKAPTAEEIRKINPFYIIDVLPFVAQVQFLPNTTDWSDNEKELFDIAVLRITGTNQDAQYFDVTMPNSFEYSRWLGDKFPGRGDEVITFGFPSGDPEYGSRFKIQGSVGQVKDLIGSNQVFANQLLEIAATMETIGGRSGSPLFWKGYVVGIISSKEDYSINSFATSILPLLKLRPL